MLVIVNNKVIFSLVIVINKVKSRNEFGLILSSRKLCEF